LHCPPSPATARVRQEPMDAGAFEKQSAAHPYPVTVEPGGVIEPNGLNLPPARCD